MIPLHINLLLRFMYYTIYLLNRRIQPPKDNGSWKLEDDLEKEMNRYDI